MAILAMHGHGRDARAGTVCGIAVLAITFHGQDARGTIMCHGHLGHARARAGRPWHRAF
jgi:hypothetical protein